MRATRAVEAERDVWAVRAMAMRALRARRAMRV